MNGRLKAGEIGWFIPKNYCSGRIGLFIKRNGLFG